MVNQRQLRTLVIDDRRVLDESAPVVKQLGALTYARNIDTGWRELTQRGPWDHVLLDHDLGLGDDIRPLVRKLAAGDVPMMDMELLHRPQYHSISANPWGRDWVTATLRDAGFDVVSDQWPCRLHRFRGDI